MTIPEAANRLNVTTRSIHNYLKKGLLRRTIRNGKALLNRDEVEVLAEELGTDLPALNRKTLFDLNTRLRKLEEQMNVVQSVWETMGVTDAPLKPNDIEAASLHRGATDYLTAQKYQAKDLEIWAGLFGRIDERVIDRIGEVTKSLQPWRPFLDLATRMADFVSEQKGFKNDLSLQLLYAKLEKGRKALRSCALLWIESGRGTAPAHLFKAVDSPEDTLARALGGNSA